MQLQAPEEITLKHPPTEQIMLQDPVIIVSYLDVVSPTKLQRPFRTVEYGPLNVQLHDPLPIRENEHPQIVFPNPPDIVEQFPLQIKPHEPAIKEDILLSMVLHSPPAIKEQGEAESMELHSPPPIKEHPELVRVI